jgi:hypothetical protein
VLLADYGHLKKLMHAMNVHEAMQRNSALRHSNRCWLKKVKQACGKN